MNTIIDGNNAISRSATSVMSDTDMAELLSAVREVLGSLDDAGTLEALDEGDPEVLNQAWSLLAEIGVDRAVLSDEQGGIDLPLHRVPELVEEIATVDPGLATAVLLHLLAIAAEPSLSNLGRAAYVPLVGIDNYPALDAVARASAQVTVSGEISMAMAAAGAASLVVVCGSGDHVAVQLRCGGGKNVECEPVGDQLGLGAARAARLRLRSTPARLLVVDRDYVEAVLHQSLARIGRGAARRASAIATSYAAERYQGGQTILGHGAVRGMLAGIRVAIEVPVSLGIATLSQAIADHVRAGADFLRATTDAVQVMGGMGYMRPMGLEKLMRDTMYICCWPRPPWFEQDRLVISA